MATLIAIEPMNAIMTKKLKIVDPKAILAAIASLMNSQPKTLDIERIPQRIITANRTAAK